MTTLDKIPYGFWNTRREELKQFAQTMTNGELAVKFGVTRKQIRNALTSFDIKRELIQPCWKEREEEVKALAPKMTAREMAAHFETSVDNMYARLAQFGVSAVAFHPKAKFDGGVEGLVEAAATMTEAQLCEKFGITTRTVRKHLKRSNVSCRPSAHPNRRWDEEDKAAIGKLYAEGSTIEQIAAQYGTTEKNMRRRMQLFGMMKRHPTSVVPKVKQVVTRAKPRLPALPASRPGRIPGSAIRLPKPKPEPAQIIMPENVKMTISHFNPPPGTRICNGSSYERYDPKARTVGARWGY